MLIFWEPRLVFLATPKAGSTAVQVALESLASVAVDRPAPLKHADSETFHRHILPWLNATAGESFTTVALMREPVSWLASWYRFLLRDDAENTDHPMANCSFDRFAQDYCAGQATHIRSIQPQSAFLGTSPHRVNRIFRYEDIDRFTHFLEDRLDCVINLPRINVPPSVDVSLSEQTRRQLEMKMADDMNLYATLAETAG
ncbi:MAG: hypothetical protein Q4G24_10780 [Paracoccus sp. (in: a-proteobacteria)]|uniref:hypothetical protein n=1 Tax=Paracoccus sp. TaxID=267 RepID=UPI0026DF728E|nr:hypothetical protein [Paracoccus sp. (in: a-proteobacteria)]MDO5621943.1 hypothetical protein [Paracoccus sp. (in: a-proteobacteria)]